MMKKSLLSLAVVLGTGLILSPVAASANAMSTSQANQAATAVQAQMSAEQAQPAGAEQMQAQAQGGANQADSNQMAAGAQQSEQAYSAPMEGAASGNQASPANAGGEG